MFINPLPLWQRLALHTRINQEIKVSLPELTKSNKPLKLASDLFCVFYEVGC